MPTRFSDRDLETLLMGGVPDDAALASLTPLVTALREDSDRPPSEDRIAWFAGQASALASDQLGEVITRRAGGARPRGPRWGLIRRFVIPLTSLALLSAMTGVALAANDAAPGEALYGVDIALENLGIGAGGVAERLGEAAAMAEKGRSAEALAHAAEAVAKGVGETDAIGALDGLQQAIEDLGQPAGENATEVRSRVQAMLQWMADNSGLINDPSVEPGAFGQGVAEIARGIKPHPNDASDQGEDEHPGKGGRPDGVNPGGRPDGIPPNQP